MNWPTLLGAMIIRANLEQAGQSLGLARLMLLYVSSVSPDMTLGTVESMNAHRAARRLQMTDRLDSLSAAQIAALSVQLQQARGATLQPDAGSEKRVAAEGYYWLELENRRIAASVPPHHTVGNIWESVTRLETEADKNFDGEENCQFEEDCYPPRDQTVPAW